MYIMKHERVEKIFSWYRSAMAQVGRKKISWPKARDKSKTYMWRQIVSFLNKIDELNIQDESIIQDIIWIMVKHAKHRKMLNRYSSLLNRGDLFDECFSELQNKLDVYNTILNRIKRSVKFLAEQSHKNRSVAVLTLKKNDGSYSNITCWFHEGKLAKHHIALSKSCCKALAELDDDERKQFPADIDILRIRNRCLRNSYLRESIVETLNGDLANGGV